MTTTPVTNEVVKREAEVEVVLPEVGDIVMILDLGGGHSFPVCIGTVKSPVPWQEG